MEFVKLTHPNPNVLKYMSLYGKALYAVLRGASVRQQAEHALRNLDVWDVCQEYSHKAEGYDVWHFHSNLLDIILKRTRSHHESTQNNTSELSNGGSSGSTTETKSYVNKQ